MSRDYVLSALLGIGLAIAFIGVLVVIGFASVRRSDERRRARGEVLGRKLNDRYNAERLRRLYEERMRGDGE